MAIAITMTANEYTVNMPTL